MEVQPLAVVQVERVLGDQIDVLLLLDRAEALDNVQARQHALFVQQDGDGARRFVDGGTFRINKGTQEDLFVACAWRTIHLPVCLSGQPVKLIF